MSARREFHATELQIPADYINIPFDLPAEEERYVGILACQINPLLKTLETKVTKCSPVPSASKEKPKKSVKGAVKEEPKEEYAIQFQDTAFFPEGGGQLHDQGHVRVIGQDAQQPAFIKDVRRVGLSAIHYSDTPLEVGAIVKQEVDWNRRWDLMLQHTGQHLLSAILEEYYDNPTLGWSLQPFPQPSYIELPRAPTSDEIAVCNKICNLAIAEGAPIRVEVSMPIDPNADHDRPSTLPADYQGGVVRCVSIYSNYCHDKNFCCGTHTSDLAHCQALHILPFTTPIRKDNCRLYFLVGPRVTHNLGVSLEQVRQSAFEFGCNTDDLVDRVKLSLASTKEVLRRERKIREELAVYLAADLVKEADKSGKAMLVRSEDELEFLSLVSAKLAECGSKEDQVFLLAATAPSGASPLIICGNGEKVTKLAGLVKEAFGSKLKGGGKGRWQGKFDGKLNKVETDQLKGTLEQLV